MRRRILKVMIASLVAMGVMFGVPMTVITWDWFTTSTHQDLSERLKRMSQHLFTGDGRGADGPGAVDLDRLGILIPVHGRLTLTVRVADPDAPSGHRVVTRQTGNDFTGPAISDTVSIGPDAELTLAIPQHQVRPTQLLAVATLLAAIVVAVVGGGVVAVLTARRLSEPLSDVARRAAEMARGDFTSAWPIYGIDELDRVSKALADANGEIALRLEREGAIVGDVSHQIRSRLTAIHLRLDELTLHEDPAVVAEAEAGLKQVERLASELDELVEASRADAEARVSIDVAVVVSFLADDFRPMFAIDGRSLIVEVDPGLPDAVGGIGRLREALSVLVDNAAVHGGGDVVIRIEALSDAQMIRVTVSDEGPGVPDELVDEIFQRGVSGAQRSGYGLSFARALVEADGGRLTLVHRVPASFAIVIPTARDAAFADLRRARVPHR